MLAGMNKKGRHVHSTGGPISTIGQHRENDTTDTLIVTSPSSDELCRERQLVTSSSSYVCPSSLWPFS